MRARITPLGVLVVEADSSSEEFALRQWVGGSVLHLSAATHKENRLIRGSSLAIYGEPKGFMSVQDVVFDGPDISTTKETR